MTQAKLGGISELFLLYSERKFFYIFDKKLFYEILRFRD